jgi:hypothetical protein
MALEHRSALPRKRPSLRRPAAGAVQLQLGVWRLPDLPWLRPRHRGRHGAGDPRRAQDLAQRRHQAVADAGLEGLPGRPHPPCRGGRHPARHRLEPVDAGAARLRHRRLAELVGPVEQAVVRRAPLLRVPREQGVQDAHPCAAVQVPQLHALRQLRRCAPGPGSAAVATGSKGRGRRRARAFKALHAAGRGLVAGPARGLAGPAPARPDAGARRAAAPLLRRPGTARRRRRPARPPAPAARRDPHATALPVRCRPGLPEPGPPEPFAVGRRGAAHQPDDRARHLAGQYAVRARRAQHRPAPARHGAHRRGHAPPARRRQYAGGGRA